MADLVIPDVSEYQGTVNWRALVAAGYPAAIVRAHNGYRADHTWPGCRDAAHAGGIRALGIYQYIASGRDVVAQANELCDLVGSLRPGEWLICDLEEGSGDQAGRGAAWLRTVAARMHDGGGSEELYADTSFWQAHNLSGAGFKRSWVAAYSASEPRSVPHELWQFTDARSFPGIGGPCDASIFHGTVDSLLVHISSTSPEDIVTPQDKQEIIDGVFAKLTGPAGREALGYAITWYQAQMTASPTAPAWATPEVAALWPEYHSLVHADANAIEAKLAALVKLVTPPVKP